MKELHERINRVIHTAAFERTLHESGIELFEFQSDWCKHGEAGFDSLPESYKNAILEGEKELAGCIEMELA